MAAPQASPASPTLSSLPCPHSEVAALFPRRGPGEEEVEEGEQGQVWAVEVPSAGGQSTSPRREGKGARHSLRASRRWE